MGQETLCGGGRVAAQWWIKGVLGVVGVGWLVFVFLLVGGVRGVISCGCRVVTLLVSGWHRGAVGKHMLSQHDTRVGSNPLVYSLPLPMSVSPPSSLVRTGV